jgi:hypothetical protein
VNGRDRQELKLLAARGFARGFTTRERRDIRKLADKLLSAIDRSELAKIDEIDERRTAAGQARNDRIDSAFETLLTATASDLWDTNAQCDGRFRRVATLFARELPHSESAKFIGGLMRALVEECESVDEHPEDMRSTAAAIRDVASAANAMARRCTRAANAIDAIATAKETAKGNPE